MSYSIKRKIMNNSVYIVLGLLLVSVIAVSVATAFHSKNKKQPPVTENLPEEHLFSEEPDVPAIQDNSDDIPSPTPVKPDVKPSFPPKPSDDKKPDPDIKPRLMIPVKGTLLKQFSKEQPVFSLTMNDYRVHPGIDISAPEGSPVCAVGDGVITELYSNPMMGMTMTIRHENGLVSVYQNLKNEVPSDIAVGVNVTAGQMIGAVGDSSLIELAETDHLHFELLSNGSHVNPMDYLADEDFLQADTE